MNLVAEQCKKERHHPEWSNVCARLVVVSQLIDGLRYITGSSSDGLLTNLKASQQRTSLWQDTVTHKHLSTRKWVVQSTRRRQALPKEMTSLTRLSRRQRHNFHLFFRRGQVILITLGHYEDYR